MKLLLFSDIHGDFKALTNLKKESKKADFVIAAGDISVMERNIVEILDFLNSFKKPILLIHGNHENEFRLMELTQMYKNLIFLHRGAHHFKEYVFLGYGGDGFSTYDPEFLKVANFFKKELQTNKSKNKKIIFITHQPPHNTGIDLLGNEPRGNKDYRRFIDEVKPHLVISGHLHENAGKTHIIERTLFINPGKQGVFVEI
ncbi:MAG: metallophosphoesterase [Candidatus Woesearchaeota archaeon]